MKNPLAIIADVAYEDLNKKEESRNRASWITKFWKDNYYKAGEQNREPYCMAAVSYWIREADRRSPTIELSIPPKMAAVRDFQAWALKVGAKVFRAGDANFEPRRGDVVSFLEGSGKLSHIGIVAEPPHEVKGQMVVTTIEANTGPDGGRDGDGVYEKKRRLTYCGNFYRIPAKAIPV